MTSERRHLLLRAAQVAGIAAALVVLLVTLSPPATSTDYRAEGRPVELPDRQLAPVDAEAFGGILVGLRGTPVVVNVWASWCAPCRAEMPLLERAANTYRGRVVFLGVASRDTRGAAASFLDEVGVTYPNVFDESGAVRAELGLRGFPTTYVFDAEGDLREAIVGGVSEQRLAAQLDDLAG